MCHAHLTQCIEQLGIATCSTPNLGTKRTWHSAMSKLGDASMSSKVSLPYCSRGWTPWLAGSYDVWQNLRTRCHAMPHRYHQVAIAWTALHYFQHSYPHSNWRPRHKGRHLTANTNKVHKDNVLEATRTVPKHLDARWVCKLDFIYQFLHERTIDICRKFTCGWTRRSQPLLAFTARPEGAAEQKTSS